MIVSTILDNIDAGGIALPEFQRGYVWNRDQARSLMDLLYRKYPVGSLLVWHTKTENADARRRPACRRNLAGKETPDCRLRRNSAFTYAARRGGLQSGPALEIAAKPLLPPAG